MSLIAMTAAGKSATAFSPADLTLAAWYDASDTATITESSGAVSAWADKGPNGYDLSQGTAGAKPTTGTATQNGLNVLTLDGGDYMGHDAGSDVIDLSPMTFFIVGRYNTGTATYSRILAARDSAGANPDYLTPNLAAFRNGADVISTASAGTFASTDKAYTADTMFIYYARSTGSTLYHAIDNGTVHSISASAPGNMRYLYIGAELFSGGSIGVGVLMTGRIAEIVIANEDLSADDITAMWSYLNDKWAVY